MLDRSTGPSLRRLLQPLRVTPLTLEEQVLLAMQFATWTWLAATKAIPGNLGPDTVKEWGPDEVRRIFGKLRDLPALDGNSNAFITDDRLISAVPDALLAHLLQEARHLVEAGFIGATFVDEVLGALGTAGNRAGPFMMPPEVVQLMVGLADIQPDDEVYTPFDDALQLALAATRAGAQRSFSEILMFSPLPYLINLLTDRRTEVRAGLNPITQPSFIDGQQLHKFAKTMAFPPINWRLPLEASERDLYDRFSERTTSGNVLTARHLLAQTSVRAVFLAPNSLLFSTGAEHTLRRDLVQGGLEAVISLPPAILFGTPVLLTVLVINLKQTAPASEILFVDGSAEKFHNRDGKGRTTLTGWRELLQTVQQRQTCDHATSVSWKSVEANDYQLMVTRYARSRLSDAVDEALRDGEAVTLENMVEFFRPLPVSPASSGLDLPNEVLEVGVADLPEYGYIRNLQKVVRLATVKNELRPLDILISVKGSVGKVGIVPPNLADIWVAGQSCLILRLNPSAKNPFHSPHSLFLYLRSAVGKACLERITSGTTVPLIQLRELRKLTVMLPSSQEQAAAEQAFSELVELQQQIEGIRKQQQRLVTQFWPLPVPMSEEPVDVLSS